MAMAQNGSTPHLDDEATASLNGYQPGEADVESAGATMTLFEHLAELRNGSSSAPSPSS